MAQSGSECGFTADLALAFSSYDTVLYRLHETFILDSQHEAKAERHVKKAVTLFNKFIRKKNRQTEHHKVC